MSRPQVVDVRGRHSAVALARLQLHTALAAYRDIFPPEAPPPSETDLAADWERWTTSGADRHRAFAAEEADQLVGAVLAGPDHDDAGHGQLSRLYVTPGRWGEGIGQLLYDRALRHLYEQGFETARLWVLEGNHRARAWYERLGWALDGRRRTMYAPAGVDDVGYSLAVVAAVSRRGAGQR